MDNDLKKITDKKIFWIYLLSSLVYFTQGIEGLPSLPLFFYMKETLHFTPEKIMYIGSITGIAWLVKPFWGYLCDNFLTKKKWIILSLIGSLSACLYFSLSSFLPLIVIIVLLSLSSFNSAIRDVACDGIMCVEGKETQNCDKIQATQWISITIASIIVGLGGGYIADKLHYKYAFLLLLPVYLIIIGIVSQYKNNKYATVCDSCYYKLHKSCHMARRGKQCPRPTLWKNIYSYRELFSNKSFLFACLFLFLYKYSPSFGTPLSFIQRDVFKWSGMWMGTLGAIVSCFEVLGAILFFKYCKKINLKKWLIFSVYLGALTTLAYLYFTPVTAIVYGIIFSVMGMFIHLIIMGFMAKNTLPGKEATSFALLCSISNLAGTASSLSGAFLYPKIGLPYLIVLSAFTSFLCLIFIKKIDTN